VDQYSAAEVEPCLHQVVSTEVVRFEWALIVAAETTLHRVNAGVAS